MLRKFSVENFKNFKEIIELDLTAGKYEYNNEAIKNNIVKNAVIFGKNGSGKSNLIYAIMDITNHLTDFQKRSNHYTIFKNLNSSLNYARFKYEFNFSDNVLTYEYKKNNVDEIYDEIVTINDKIVIFEDFQKGKRKVDLKGAESLNVEKRDLQLSLVKYVFTNTKLDNNDEFNKVFHEFKEFVYGMLYFSSGTSEGNFYQGFKIGRDNIASTIIESGHLKKLEKFLKELEINYVLESGKDDAGNSTINVRFANQSVNIFNVLSHGTYVILVFYYWLTFLDEIKFLVIDEFDAYYHNTVARKLLSLIQKSSAQSIFTSHNSFIMTNDLLRPDSYFIIQNNKIKDLSHLTRKELRFAHNLEKMYNAGAFDE